MVINCPVAPLQFFRNKTLVVFVIEFPFHFLGVKGFEEKHPSDLTDILRITVNAIVNGQGAIAYLTVDASGETEGLGQKVMETEYLVQFLGKRLPLTLGTDVEAVTGATVTSKAITHCVNSAVAYVTGADATTEATSWGG